MIQIQGDKLLMIYPLFNDAHVGPTWDGIYQHNFIKQNWNRLYFDDYNVYRYFNYIDNYGITKKV